MIEFGSNKVVSIKEYYFRALTPLYGKGEAEALTYLTFEYILGFRKHQVSVKSEEPLNESSIVEFVHTLKRLRNYEPLQYIFEKAWFRGLELKVNQHVLIPRPETEELVEEIITSSKSINNPRILDLCTGSGCIAIALKKEIPLADVTGIEVSEDALYVARENALLNNCEVRFLKQDVLEWNIDSSKDQYDIIVSNPPYIPYEEANEMQKNVLAFEPGLALFVKDDDPLLFYRVIATHALKLLKPHGSLFFELNERFGKETKDLIISLGYEDIQLIKDINGKDRMLRAKKERG
jgi:release factor glutamine methyltransferase